LRLPADLCIWSAGVKVNALASSLPFLKDDRGRIVLENTYMVASHPGVFAAGDCAALVNPHTKRADPQSAQVAHYQAHDLSKNIVRYLQGRPLKVAHLPKRWVFFSALGGACAAGTIAGLKFWGYPAFLLRRISDLYYFYFLLPPLSALRVWLEGVRLYKKNDY
jgi:NADH dehydrogenase